MVQPRRSLGGKSLFIAPTISRTLRAANPPIEVASALFVFCAPVHKRRMNDSQTFTAPNLPGSDWPQMQPGWVWLVGAGPGDPGLLTIHAVNALSQADVIVHDALVAPEILSWARPETEVIYAGKRGGKPSAKQRDISLQLVDLARAGKKVLRLKGGDPFVFGRGGEEGQTLVQHGVPIRIIPGISAGIGGLAYAGIPVTHRAVNQSVTFVTGHDETSGPDTHRAGQCWQTRG